MLEEAGKKVSEGAGEDALEQNSHQATELLPSKGLYLFIVACLLLCLLPFVGMLWTSNEPLHDDGSLSSLPQFVVADGNANVNYFPDLGNYFEDHFAYRNVAIDINARIRADLFKTSSTDQVIVGREGWLYYGGTLSDYLARDPLSNREARNIAHNLALMQGYTNAMGSEFVIAIAPNKNSLYSEYMPYYYQSANNESMTLLKEQLVAEEINYVDLFEAFEATDKELYAKTDTHWTTEGALLAANEILVASGKEAVAPLAPPAEGEIEGDIEHMLYPLTAGTEESLLIETGTWQYASTAKSVEDDVIATTSPEGAGTLLMYRDSFANTLIPYLAPAYSKAHFTKMVPYNFTEIAQIKPSVVVVERAERNIRLLGEDPPFMYAPTVQQPTVSETLETESRLAWRQDGGFRVIEGFVDENYLDEDDDIFIMIEGPQGVSRIYVPFHVSIKAAESATEDVNTHLSEYGFMMYLNESSLTEGEYIIRVMVIDPQDNEARVIKNTTLVK